MLYIQPDSFADEKDIVAGFSTRLGGVSESPFNSLNLGLSTADNSEDVHQNRKLLFEQAGFSVDRLAITGQVHGTEVLDVDAPGLFVLLGALGVVFGTGGAFLLLRRARWYHIVVSYCLIATMLLLVQSPNYVGIARAASLLSAVQMVITLQFGALQFVGEKRRVE